MKAATSVRVRAVSRADEVAVLKREVGPAVGGEDKLGFEVLNGRMTVAADAPTTAAEVIAVGTRTGMRADPWRDADATPPTPAYGSGTGARC